MWRQKIFLGFLLLLGLTRGIAQSISYTNYTAEDGLPSNTIYSVTADNQGFIWISTDYGVSRFDGFEFTTFTKSDGLADNEIFNFFVDSKDRVWFYSFNGKMSYYHNGRIYNESNVDFLNQLKLSSRVSDIREDKNGNLIFAGDEGNSMRLSSENKIVELLKDDNSQKKFLIKTKEGEVFNLIKYENFIQSLTGSEKRILDLHSIPQNQYASLLLAEYPSEDIYKHFFDLENIDDDKGAVYIQKQDSIYWTFGNETPLRKCKKVGRELQILKENKEIFGTSAYLDNENNLWVSTFGRGLFKINNHIESQFIIGENLKNDLLSSMLVYDNKVVLGTESGELSLVEKGKIKDVQWPYVEKRIDGSSRTKIRQINMSPLGDILILKNQGLYSFSNDLLKVNTAINGTFKDIDFIGNELVAAKANNVVRYYTKNLDHIKPIYNERSTAILAASNGVIWIGTNKGLFKSFKDEKIDTIDFPILDESNINGIIQLASDLIVIGTNGDGIFTIYDDKIERITTHDGILGNIIKHLFLDEDNQVWASTNHGVSKIKFTQNRIESIQNFTKDDGISSNNVIQTHVTSASIYALCANGLTVIARDKYNAKPQNDPKILLNKVSVNGVESDLKGLKNLSHKENEVSFDYSSISFNHAQNMSFKYRLMGSNKDWQISKKRSLQFLGLAAGNYQLEVVPFLSLATQSDSKVAGLTIPFNIKPPWYKSMLFRILSIVFLFFAVLLYMQSRIAKEKEKSKLDLKLVELQQRALLTQMNPHFINNCLSSIQQFILSGDKREANNQLSKFANLIRLIVSNSRNNSVSLKQEIEHLQLYLELEQLRFSNKFDFEVNIGPDLNSVSTNVPSMLFQPLVENAVLHAFDFSKRNNNMIKVHFSKEGNYVRCVVEDNGIGIQASKLRAKKSHSLGIATKNIEERITIMKKSKPKSAFTYEDLSEGMTKSEGTRAIIVVPILIESND